MPEDPRCCGSGTCIIDAQGRCWCGQRWDGEKMCHEAKPGVGSASGVGSEADPSHSEPLRSGAGGASVSGA